MARKTGWVRRLLILLLLMASCGAGFAQPSLHLKARLEANAVRIEMSSSAPLHHRIQTVSQPSRAIVVELFPARLDSRFEIEVHSGLVSRLRARQLSPDTVRLTIETLALPACKLRGEGSVLEVSLDKTLAGKDWPVDGIRQEVLLEKAPVGRVIRELEERFPDCVFTPHPTMNGFFMQGYPKTILLLKSEIANLERFLEPPSPAVRISRRIDYADLCELKALLTQLVPGVQIDTDPNVLIVVGPPAAIELVLEMLEQIDACPGMIMLDLKLVYLSEAGLLRLGPPWFVNPTTLQGGVTTTDRGAVVKTEPTCFSLEPGTAADLLALVERGEAKILASPRVGTIEGKSALVRFGALNRPHLDVGLGVHLEFIRQGDIDLDLRAELVDDQFPWVRKMSGSIRVKDGESILIRGLFGADDLPRQETLFRALPPDAAPDSVVLLVTPHYTR